MEWSNMSCYKMKQTFKETDDEMTVTIKLKIKKNKDGLKLINRMYKKQESPIVTLMREWEKQNRQNVEEEKSRPYYIEGELNKL